MKFEYGLIIVMGFLVAGTLALISNQPDEILRWNTLHQIILQDSDIECNLECKENAEGKDFSCTEVAPDEYVCRPPRAVIFPEREYPIPTAFPPEYGEFAYFPDGYETVKMRIFDIAKVDLINPDTKQIKVEFAHHNLEDPQKQFSYFATLVPGDNFVSHCTGSNFKTGHVVEYLDVFELDDTIYIEFWGSHIIMPDSLLPCEMPALIEHSLPIDLSLGVKFDMPKSELTIKKSEIHQCQWIVMDQYELYRQDRQSSSSLSNDDLKAWNNFVTQRAEHHSKEFEKNCQDSTDEWLTDEYNAKIKELSRTKFRL